jgi:hypothetical protein
VFRLAGCGCNFGDVEVPLECLQENNKQPKPFVWTATVEQILAQVNRCNAILDTLH